MSYNIQAPPEEEHEHAGQQQAVYYDEDEANMAEIEREMAMHGVPAGHIDEDEQNLAELDMELAGHEHVDDNLSPHHPAYHPTNHHGGLNAHAAEFWFPESRACACCKGFKHGCKCVKEAGKGVCQDCTGGAK